MRNKSLASIADEYEKPKPRITFDVKQVPDIKKWDVGKTYEFTLKGKMISKSEGGWSGKEPLEATFEVTNTKNIEVEEEY